MFKQIDPKELDFNVFSAIGDQWMLITAGTADRCNTMTASWGGLGILWNVPMATVYIRPQRYTKQFVDENEYFTLTFFSQNYRKELALCGTRSGRDVDKFEAMHLTKEEAQVVNVPMIAESPVNIECKVVEVKELGSHDMFLAEVVAVHADEAYMDEKGRFSLTAAEPIAYSHGTYFTLGEQLGTFGYSVKKGKSGAKSGSKKPTSKNSSGKRQ